MGVFVTAGVRVGVFVATNVPVGVLVKVFVAVNVLVVGVFVKTDVDVRVGVFVKADVDVGVGVGPEPWHTWVPESVNVLPASGTNCQS